MLSLGYFTGFFNCWYIHFTVESHFAFYGLRFELIILQQLWYNHSTVKKLFFGQKITILQAFPILQCKMVVPSTPCLFQRGSYYYYYYCIYIYIFTLSHMIYIYIYTYTSVSRNLHSFWWHCDTSPHPQSCSRQPWPTRRRRSEHWKSAVCPWPRLEAADVEITGMFIIKKVYVPSGKLIVYYSKSQFWIGKSTLNGHFE